MTGSARHTCGGPVFGRKTPGCPRCDELLAGAEPRQLPEWRQRRIDRANEDQRRVEEIRAHFESAKHRSGGCGLCCTFGDW
jgi:hypothetical protein